MSEAGPPVGVSSSTEPEPAGLAVTHELDLSVRFSYGRTELARYVYRPWDVQLESPRPYFHPVRTLRGDVVSLYRPHDHVWHKGIAWSLPNVGTENFWGGTTFRRDDGYAQLANNGAMQHRSLSIRPLSDGAGGLDQTLEWVTQAGQTWFTERRAIAVRVHPGEQTWSLVFSTALTNVSGEPVRIGSPTTEGRPNAGYGGLFWRGPRSFSGGTVYTPDETGGDEMMGVRAPWMAYAGRHDDHGRWSSLVFVDDTSNVQHPTQWFVRTGIYACLCPAPFFSDELEVSPGATLALRYAVLVADGDVGREGASELAVQGAEAMKLAAEFEPTPPFRS